jgi:hypothetical protein
MKLYKLFFLLIFISPLQGSFAFAKASFPSTVESSVVKVVSRFSDGSAELRGSGLAFKFHGTSFVLTSDHVFLHGNTNVVHEIGLPDGGTLIGKVVASDYGRGLGLLTVATDVKTKRWIELDTFVIRDVQVGEPVRTIGFPFSSSSVIVDTLGKIKLLASLRQPLIQMPGLIEIQSSLAEFGMSGGAVESQSGEWIGVLSHQVLESNQDNTALVIPARIAREWAQAVLEHPGQVVAEIVQTPDQQLSQNLLSFSTAQITFAFLNAFGGNASQLIIFPSANSFPPSLLYDGPEHQVARYQEFLKINPDCTIYVLGFRKKDQPGSRAGVANEVVAMVQALRNSQYEAITQLSCPGRRAIIKQ